MGFQNAMNGATDRAFSKREVGVPERTVPLVSVVMPSYNHERYVGEAIESVLAQSVDDFEIIIIDDGSSDGSVNVVKKFSDTRIRLYVQNNQGAHNALNRGATLASAPWIVILNSDDRFHPDKLEKHLEVHARHPNLDASVSRVRYITEGGDPVNKYGYLAVRYEQCKQVRLEHDSLFASLLVVNHLITTSCLFINREVFQTIGGFIPLRYVHDWFMFLTLAARGRLHVIEEELTDYRRHRGNTIVEDDDRGRVEDNFVLEWQVYHAIKSEQPLITLEQALRILCQNKRINYRLIFLFELWRQINDNDLEKATVIFAEQNNSLLNYALQLLRSDKGARDIFTAFKRGLGSRWWSVADYLTRAGQMVKNTVRD
ncbi:MAG: glycosyltransferase [Desulfomonile sp.]